MSIKDTAAYDGGGEYPFHLYTDREDHRGVFLKLTDVDFDATQHGVTVLIPWSVWENIRYAEVSAPSLRHKGR